MQTIDILNFMITKQFFLLASFSFLSSCSNTQIISDWADIKILSDGDIWINKAYTIKAENVINLHAENGSLSKGKFEGEYLYTYDQNLLKNYLTQFPLQDTFHYQSSGNKSFTKKIRIPKSDPLDHFSWHLYNNGQNFFGVAINSHKGIDLNVIDAWQKKDRNDQNLSGLGIIIALLDGPADVSHEDLKDRIYQIKKNNLDKYINQEVSLNQLKNSHSNEFHGSETAGLIAATGFNNKGIRGIAYNSKLYSIDLLRMQDQLGDQALKQALNTIIDLPETNVVNISLGSYLYGINDHNEHLFKKLYEKNIPIVHASGNEFQITKFNNLDLGDVCLKNRTECQSAITDDLSRSKYIINVGAINAQGTKASYSSTRPNIWISAIGGEDGYQNSSKDSAGIVAPYSHYSCQRQTYDKDGLRSPWRNYGDITCRYTAKMKGTSAAAAEVSGIVALLKQIDHNFSVPQIKYILAKSGRSDLNIASLSYPNTIFNNINTDLGWTTNQSGMRYSNYYGFGLVDTSKAIDIALNCNKDAYCNKRSVTPKVNLSSNNTKCLQKSKTIECSMSNDYDDSIEIEDVSLSLGKIIPKISLLNEFKNYNDLVKKIIPFYQNLQIELLSPSGTLSIIKPAGALWLPMTFLNDYKENDVLSISASIFYMEKIKGNKNWKVIIKNVDEQLNMKELEEKMSLSIIGY